MRPNLRFPGPVASCVRDRAAVRRVSLVLDAAGAEAVAVRWAELAALPSPPTWRALIYDLEPWDHRALEAIRRVSRVAPAAPMLIYVPHVPGVGPLLEECAGDPRIFVKLQFTDGAEVERLRSEIERMRLRMPCQQLEIMLRAALPDLPERARSYIRRSLRALAGQRTREHPTAHAVATSMGVSVRTLERAFHAAGVPQPKEMLNWLTLLYLMLFADRSGMSPAATARAMRWRPNDVYRLRHRLLKGQHEAVRRAAGLSGRGNFDLVFLAFVSRCGISETRGRELLSKAG